MRQDLVPGDSLRKCTCLTPGHLQSQKVYLSYSRTPTVYRQSTLQSRQAGGGATERTGEHGGGGAHTATDRKGGEGGNTHEGI